MPFIPQQSPSALSAHLSQPPRLHSTLLVAMEGKGTHRAKGSISSSVRVSHFLDESESLPVAERAGRASIERAGRCWKDQCQGVLESKQSSDGATQVPQDGPLVQLVSILNGLLRKRVAYTSALFCYFWGGHRNTASAAAIHSCCGHPAQ